MMPLKRSLKQGILFKEIDIRFCNIVLRLELVVLLLSCASGCQKRVETCQIFSQFASCILA
jgi:hypothetical protein